MSEILVRKRTRAKGNDTWEYRFESAQIGGKRQWISKSGFESKREAKKAGYLAQQNYERFGSLEEPTEMSVSDYFDYWLKKDCLIDLRESTVDGYRKRINLYIKPEIGKLRLKKVSRDDLQDLLLKMYNKLYTSD